VHVAAAVAIGEYSPTRARTHSCLRMPARPVPALGQCDRESCSLTWGWCSGTAAVCLTLIQAARVGTQSTWVARPRAVPLQRPRAVLRLNGGNGDRWRALHSKRALLCDVAVRCINGLFYV
jgi:hypothetical protein